VAIFTSELDVYEHLGRLFEEMLTDPETAEQCQRADTIVQYRYHEPDATITIDIRQECEPIVDLGQTELVPEVTMSMAADTAHRFFLGHVNVTVALARGEIKARGPVSKILKLVPLVKPFFPRYQALVEAAGRGDRVTA